MSVLTLQSVHLAYGHTPLLTGADFSLLAGERVGVIGRNGTGKSSFLKLLAGVENPDAGIIHRQHNLRLAWLAQEPVLAEEKTVFDNVAQGLADILAWREALSSTSNPTEAGKLQAAIDTHDGWRAEQRIATAIARCALSPTTVVGQLSGGGKKRVALAAALVRDPDVLLLDEPTNHLDLRTITWLEGLLQSFAGAVVVVTHDRRFLDNVVQRIVEIDRGQVNTYDGNFSVYQRLKEVQLAHEAVVRAKADRLLAKEEVWIRRGVEARRTRASARIDRLEKLRQTRQARREVLGDVRFSIDTGLESSRLVVQLQRVSHSFDEHHVIRDFEATILRGDKVGLIGPNGAGKTTLLRILLGELKPTRGVVKVAANLQVAYFDQMRAALDLDATLESFISPGSEWVEIGGKRQHVKSYLADFLFPPARSSAKVSSLSGGERNRLLLARLFARPANVLVLDEPTNDLDIDSLELLEDVLQDYKGTVFLVSHDRSFLNNVVTSTIAYEGNGQWREYEGGVDDWLHQSRGADAWETMPGSGGRSGGTAETMSEGAEVAANTTAAKAVPKKLSFKEMRELEALPRLIESLEKEQKDIVIKLSDPTFYTRQSSEAGSLTLRSQAIEEELGRAFIRWEELEQKAAAYRQSGQG